MNKYENGKIYKIEPLCEHEEGDIYIGSTIQKLLCNRMAKHRSTYKNNGEITTAFKLFDQYGVENCIITLLENVKCESKDELLARERFYIQSLKCVNKYIPLRTNKEWFQDNKEKIKCYQKQYKNNRKDFNKEYHKQYREDNKEKLKEKISMSFKCECGSIFQICKKSRHLKTKKHQDFVNHQSK